MLLLLLLNIILNAVLIVWLWGWFMVPLGLPPISYAHAYGIDLLISYIVSVGSHNMMTVEETHPWWTSQSSANTTNNLRLRALSMKVVFIVLGYVVHYLMGVGW